VELRNRYRVIMHGNQPVVEDSKTFERVWFSDVLHDLNSRRNADILAKKLNTEIEAD